MTLDILICTLNKGIVRLGDILMEPREGVRYIVSYQYTDERYLDLVPSFINDRADVSLYKYQGQGLSANRNLALEKATSTGMPKSYIISAIEMVCRRETIQRSIRFDERFGLGTKFLTCGEEEIWMEDAKRCGLRMKYFPIKIVETSTLLKKNLIYVDAGVQRSYGAIMYYKQGGRAWMTCIRFALRSARSGYCHFWPILRHMFEGIHFMRKTK